MNRADLIMLISQRLRVTFFLVTSLSAANAIAQGEWISLIDGTEGIENFNPLGDANWTAEMASIRATEGNGSSWLVSRQNYTNFEIRVEFWASHDANSGVYLRCQNPERITDRDCYEANIFDQRPEAAYGTGGIVHVAPVSEP
ncbi:MAG: 3-keto-disaccharide hydrolase, partial [Pseudohongiellaceae bacterium]